MIFTQNETAVRVSTEIKDPDFSILTLKNLQNKQLLICIGFKKYSERKNILKRFEGIVRPST